MTRTESIIFLTPGFPGTEVETDCLPPVQNFIKALAHHNPDVTIHVVSFQYPFKAAIYSWHGVIVHALAGGNEHFPMRFLTWLRAAWRVRQLVRSHKVIALHSMWLAECSYVASWMARICGLKHVASIQGLDALASNPYLRHLRLDQMIVTAGSEKAAERFFQCTKRRVDRIIPIGLDSEALTPLDKTAERTIDILGVGSLIPIKNFRDFLEIVSMLRADYPALRCTIAGEGPERARLETYIQEHQLGTAVQLVGNLSRETVLEIMRKSRILLHTSEYEGQGYVLIEALAAGMSVVCRDVGYTGDSPNAYRCNSFQEMAGVLKTLLAAAIAPIEPEVLAIDQTVCDFVSLYRAD